MSKIASLAAAGVGGGGIIAGGCYLASRGSKETQEQEADESNNLPKELSKFQEGNGGECVQKVFAGVASMKKPDTFNDITSSADILGNAAGDTATSCLVINWDGKQTDKKWQGNFRFVWALAKGSKGFLIYATVNTKNPIPDTNAKVNVEGVFYALTQSGEDNNKTWAITNGKEIDKKEWDVAKFPKLGQDLKEGQENLLCLTSETDCTNPQPDETFRKYWEWENQTTESAKTIDVWSTNLEEWWKEIYDENKCKIKDTVKEIKGAWKVVKMAEQASATPTQGTTT